MKVTLLLWTNSGGTSSRISDVGTGPLSQRLTHLTKGGGLRDVAKRQLYLQRISADAGGKLNGTHGSLRAISAKFREMTDRNMPAVCCYRFGLVLHAHAR